LRRLDEQRGEVASGKDNKYGVVSNLDRRVSSAKATDFVGGMLRDGSLNP
jgi:hypothetical protein